MKGIKKTLPLIGINSYFIFGGLDHLPIKSSRVYRMNRMLQAEKGLLLITLCRI